MPAIRDKGTRQDTFTLRVSLNGNTLGIWDKKTGGGLDSDELKYTPGDGIEISLGGLKKAGNLTLQRIYDRADDHDKINTLYASVGKGRVSVSQRPRDFDGNEYGKAIHWTGTLKRVQEPDVDSESSTSAALIEIEVTVSGYPAAA